MPGEGLFARHHPAGCLAVLPDLGLRLWRTTRFWFLWANTNRARGHAQIGVLESEQDGNRMLAAPIRRVPIHRNEIHRISRVYQSGAIRGTSARMTTASYTTCRGNHEGVSVAIGAMPLYPSKPHSSSSRRARRGSVVKAGRWRGRWSRLVAGGVGGHGRSAAAPGPAATAVARSVVMAERCGCIHGHVVVVRSWYRVGPPPRGRCPPPQAARRHGDPAARRRTPAPGPRPRPVVSVTTSGGLEPHQSGSARR